MMKLFRLLSILLVCLVVAQPIHAQDQPAAWAPEHRPLADTLSTVAEGVLFGMDLYHDVQSQPDRRWQVLGCDGLKYGLVVASSETLKKVTHVERPDGTDRLSFPSGHATNAFAAINGWQLGTSLTLAVGTGYLRLAANRHRWPDVIAGAVLGSVINYGVSRIPACRGTMQ